MRLFSFYNPSESDAAQASFFARMRTRGRAFPMAARFAIVALFACLGACLGACLAPAQPLDRGAALQATVTQVIVPTFDNLAQQALRLDAAAERFQNVASAESLDELRSLFREAFFAEKRSEVFPFGPSEDVLLAGAIDARPVNAARLDAIIASRDILNAEFVSTQGASSRGLPGIEFLLFDPSAPPATLDLRLLGSDAPAARRRTLLRGLTQDLAKQTAALRDAWTGAKGYSSEMANAGRGSKVFSAQKDAIDQLVTGMIYIAERALVAKLAKPMGIDTGTTPRKDEEEAPRSDLSLRALEQNMMAIRAVYRGTSNDDAMASTTKASLASETRMQSASADKNFEAAIERAIVAIRAVVPTMREVLAGGDVKALAPVHLAIREVKRLLATEVASALGASIGFGYSDTD